MSRHLTGAVPDGQLPESTHIAWYTAELLQATRQVRDEAFREHWAAERIGVVRGILRVGQLDGRSRPVGGQRVGGLVLHWNGSRWELPPEPGGYYGYEALTGVAALSARDAWAVDSYAAGTSSHPANAGSPRSTLVVRWNGTAWSRVPSPNPDSDNRLTGGAVVNAKDARAVGYYRSARVYCEALILHWNGPGMEPGHLPGGRRRERQPALRRVRIFRRQRLGRRRVRQRRPSRRPRPALERHHLAAMMQPNRIVRTCVLSGAERGLVVEGAVKLRDRHALRKS
jgi:hypothetical protein